MASVTPGIDQWRGDRAGGPGEQTGKPLLSELEYRPFPRQREFHKSLAKYRLFGGAAGPGKSMALLMETVVQAWEHPGANTLLLRRTFPELEQSLLLYFRREVPRELYRTFNESKHLVEWWNGSTTRFGYCQHENDVYQYQGAEFLFIGIDELTLFTLRQWQFLTSRNRCPLPGSFACMAAATNPGNIGHAWVKSLWIDKEAAAGMEHAEQYDPSDYDFIAARVWDNPIYAGDEAYLKTLRSLPSHLKRAFLDGDWDVFAGQYFDRFSPATHVVRAETIDWKPWWPRWISIDWGFEHPAAAYWHATVPADQKPPTAGWENPRTDGGTTGSRVVTYREFVTRRTPPRELAQKIVERTIRERSDRLLPRAARDSTDRGAEEKIDAIYLSPDAFARRTDEASIADQMGDVFAGAGFPRPIPADDDRVSGWMLMYQMLDAREWLLTDNCAELIRTLPILVRDPIRIEDIQKSDGDDAADAARYGLKSRYGIRRNIPADEPLEQRLATKVTAMDPTIRAMQAKKAQLEEMARAKPIPFLRRRRLGSFQR